MSPKTSSISKVNNSGEKRHKKTRKDSKESYKILFCFKLLIINFIEKCV